MLAKVHSAAVLGIDSYPIEIEVNAGWRQPAVIIVGLPDAAVKESRDRVKTAIENRGDGHDLGIRQGIAAIPSNRYHTRHRQLRVWLGLQGIAGDKRAMVACLEA